MSEKEALETFQQALPFLRSFNPFSIHLANFRDTRC